MELIVLSHLYPKQNNNYHGIFIEEQIRSLKRLDVINKITVIVPVPWPQRFSTNRNIRSSNRFKYERNKAMRSDIDVYYRSYLAFPGKHLMPLQGFFIYLSIRFLVNQIVKQNNQNILIHAHTVLPDGLACVMLKKKFDIKTVCTAHGSDIYLYPFRTYLSHIATKYVLKSIDKLVTVSQFLKKISQSIAYRNDISIVTNGVEPKKFSFKEAKEKKNYLIKNTITIIFVGDLSFDKGLRELFQSFKMLKREFSNIFLLLVGKNYIPDWTSSYVARNQLNDCIEFAGVIKHNMLKYYYSRASIFVLPSYYEGMPTVMFEAMCSKLAIVISDVGGVKEVIEHKINGLLIQPRVSSDLYMNLKLCIQDERLRSRIAKNAFEDVLSKYTWENNALKMIRIYNKLLLQ